ncbi:MAG TPA: SRPBCC family protein [Alphaproteobacteria bacterium]|nr:SRPBCC family protein [Alphaproteobacteria bacterium]
MSHADELARAVTLPAAWYSDPQYWERERHAIFAKEWLMLGRESQLAEPGSYIASEVAGWPVFVIRDREGGLRGFHNVCRHRAGPIVWEGQGRCDVLRCRYHGWVYDHEGRLRRTPDFGEAAGFDKADYSLFPIQVASWRGLVFVNLDRNAPPLAEALAGFDAETRGWPLEAYSFHSEVVHEIECNWKTYVDNYQEGYHVPAVHPGLDREIDSKQYEVLLKDRYVVHQAPQRAGAAYTGLWLWRFPTLALNIYETGMNIERMVPLGPNRTRLIYNFFFRDVSAEAEPAIQASLAISREVTEEDVKICEAVQRNLNAGLYDIGRMSPRHENGVWFFQKLVREALGEAA